MKVVEDTEQNQANEMPAAPGRRRVGRPKQAPELLKTDKIEIVGTPEEIAAIRRSHAAYCNGKTISMSQFARDVLTGTERISSGKRQCATEQKDDTETLRYVRTDLGRVYKALNEIGKNYNQKIKRINSLRVSAKLMLEVLDTKPVYKALEAMCDRLGGLLDKLEKY